MVELYTPFDYELTFVQWFILVIWFTLTVVVGVLFFVNKRIISRRYNVLVEEALRSLVSGAKERTMLEREKARSKINKTYLFAFVFTFVVCFILYAIA